MVSLLGRVRTHASVPILAIVVTLLAAGLVLAGTSNARSEDRVAPRVVDGPCGTPAPAILGTSERHLTHDGVDRRFLVHVPESYDGSRALPVVVLFHGLGRNPEQMMHMTRMNQLADTENFVVVAPQALGRTPAWKFRSADGREGSDLAFVDDLLDDVRSVTCTDESRTYAVGFSNGGALTMALACRADDRFAAYASVAGPYRTDECGQAPARPLVTFHGMKDKVVPVKGAKTEIGRLPSAMKTAATWAQQNGCAPVERTRVVKGVSRLAYTPCHGGATVEAYFLSRGKHRWPGGAKPGATKDTPRVPPVKGDVDASQLIWDFVSAHHTQED